MGTKLKTDSWHRYVLYRRDEFMRGMLLGAATKEAAIEAGQKYTLAAHADVWVKDAELVGRVRQFLGANIPWHDRLARSGSDLEVVQMLQSMVRSGVSAVVVIPEELPSGGRVEDVSTRPSASSFWGRTDYDAELDVPLADRYRTQLERMNAGGPTWAEIQAMMDDINAEFMHAMVLNNPVGMLPLFAQAGWISKYGLPDLSSYGADEGIDGESPLDREVSARLDEADAFEYAEYAPTGDEENLAGMPIKGGPPNTWVENPSGSGQLRLYDANGNAAVDIDFDHDHGAGAPHSHNWNGRDRDLGNPVSILPY
ncbi:hypothetical protein [Paraburkholderia hospita]|jgi:hypothetical protein|uniref:Uncharacterized protein n=1 Tax=Paraburkholderia hospita TaxID=169430 RepID=A0ABN0FLI3_9BURK|nr:hypothetical protein [Paraburkholderia hospita]EIM99594.1 hypothetical protein WQE_18199 [Paraburkholderia hospita]OUL72627.1 hypothetical protein CA602_42845 [Paraburkholderia hospita]OUL79168.1 hypothetical protein CA601_35160 [Paraburkholderia hospita]OUL96248.1 hypothetical protein CA603_05780 [Paraburkholderia hospita]